MKKIVFAAVAIIGTAYAISRLYYKGWYAGWIEAAILPRDDEWIVEL